MVDANCAYKLYEAIQLAKRIEEFDPFWFRSRLRLMTTKVINGWPKPPRSRWLPVKTSIHAMAFATDRVKKR